MKFTRMSYLVVLLGCILFLVGCNPVEMQASKTAADFPSPSQTNTMTRTTTPFLTTTPTLTATIEPSSTKTKSPTLTPSWTPRPTLPLDEAIETVQELIRTNGGCEFPCWWGLVPGETTWWEAEAFLKPLAYSTFRWRDPPKGRIGYTFSLPLTEEPNWYNDLEVKLLYDAETKIIEIIRSGLRQSFQPFIEQLGVPTEIYIYAYDVYGTAGYYQIYFYYPYLGVMVLIVGESDIERRNGEDFNIICQDLMQKYDRVVGFTFWSPENPKPFSELILI